jgi:hypothetical protein
VSVMYWLIDDSSICSSPDGSAQRPGPPRCAWIAARAAAA